MKLLNIATLIALLTVVDHSSSHVLATTTTTTKTSEYETLEQEDDAGVVVPLPSLLRAGAKKKEVYQFLSDGNGDGDSSSRCGMTYDLCDPNDPDNAGCCSGWHCGIGHTCLTNAKCISSSQMEIVRNSRVALQGAGACLRQIVVRAIVVIAS